VDTNKAEIAANAIRAGASIVNDIKALHGSEMLSLLQSTDAGIVIMHMKGTPDIMQQNPRYENVTREVTQFLKERAGMAVHAGIAPERIVIDPGIGFGKTLEHNLELLQNLEQIASLGYPVLVGTSRKSFIGALTGAPPQDRVFGTAATVALAIACGAAIVRVHDVNEMKQVVTVADAIVRRHVQ
jgi:dihydropteroate synthase